MQSRPWPLAIASTVVMLLFLIPCLAMRLESSDAGNDPSNTSTYAPTTCSPTASGPGFNGPLQIAPSSSNPASSAQLSRTCATPSRARPASSR